MGIFETLRKRVWQVRMMRWTGYCLLAHTGYIWFTDLALIKAFEQEVLEEHAELEKKVEKEYNRIISEK
ncbi:unnamed protein product [Blepharisma stoltei]|uniref:Uncharacterized protein n=1 Tax=Blepharisma stoltei TaxID=1481888 RepID=A0AAU9J7I5_9CILI|nr:unnamed protein product [Blepharisma stoltei]